MSSLHFFDPKKLESDNPDVSVWVDEDEWQVWLCDYELSRLFN
jgi:hypothetical protein